MLFSPSQIILLVRESNRFDLRLISFSSLSHIQHQWQISRFCLFPVSQKTFRCTNTRPRRTSATPSLHFGSDKSKSLSERAGCWWFRALGDWFEARKNRRGEQIPLRSISKTALWAFPDSRIRTTQRSLRFAPFGRLQSYAALRHYWNRLHTRKQRSPLWDRQAFERKRLAKGRNGGDGRQQVKNGKDPRLKTILKWESDNEV